MFKPTPEQITAWVAANFDYKTRKGGAEIVMNSPFDGDTGRNFNINPEKGTCHDWRGDGWAGGKSTTFIRMVMVYRNCTFIDAVKEVCGSGTSIEAIKLQLRNAYRSSESKEPQEKTTAGIFLPEGSVRLLESPSKKIAAHVMRWLAGRGITEEMMKKYDIHHSGLRVVWPYYEYDELVYWQSRECMDKVYLFPDESTGVTKGMFLYGFDYVEPSDYAIIVEAIFGAHTLGDQTLASGGAALTDKQIRKLRALNPVRGVILAPDNDKAGIASLIHNYYLISPYFKVYYSLPPKLEYQSGGETKRTKDWNEMYEKVLRNHAQVRKIFEDGVKPLDLPKVLEFSRLVA